MYLMMYLAFLVADWGAPEIPYVTNTSAYYSFVVRTKSPMIPTSTYFARG